MPTTRPTSVTVLGVLNIIFGAWGLLGIVMLTAVSVIVWAAGGVGSPFRQLLEAHPVAMGWTLSVIPRALLGSVLLIVAGIGLLKMKRWARTASIVWAIYSIAGCLTGMAVYFVAMSSALDEAGRWGTRGAAGAVARVLRSPLGGCIGLIYPAILLIFMFRRSVVEAFRVAAEAQRA